MLTHVRRIRARPALQVWYEFPPGLRTPADRPCAPGAAGTDAVPLRASALFPATSPQVNKVAGRHVGGLTEPEVDVKFKLASIRFYRGFLIDSACSRTRARCITVRAIDTHFHWYPRSFIGARRRRRRISPIRALATVTAITAMVASSPWTCPCVVRSATRTSRLGCRRTRCHGHLYNWSCLRAARPASDRAGHSDRP